MRPSALFNSNRYKVGPLFRWNEQDIPFYAFRAEEPYRTPAYPALHNENLLFELSIVPSRFLAKELTLCSRSISCGLSKSVDPRYWGEIEDFLESCVTSVKS